MESGEEIFDARIEEISNLYETMKSDFLSCSMPAIHSPAELLFKSNRFYESLMRLREIACMNIREQHAIKEN